MLTRFAGFLAQHGTTPAIQLAHAERKAASASSPTPEALTTAISSESSVGRGHAILRVRHLGERVSHEGERLRGLSPHRCHVAILPQL